MLTGRARTRALVTAAVVGLLLSACGPVDKQHAVRAVATAAGRREERVGTLSIVSRPRVALTLPGGGAPASRPPAAAAVTPISAPVVVDPARRRAALLAPAAAAARIGPTSSGGLPPIVLFDGSRVYVRSADTGTVGARPWLSLDTETLGPISTPDTDQLTTPRTLGDLAVVSPLTLIEASYGLLTGSVKHNGTVQLTSPAGAPIRANAFAGNTSLDKIARALHRDPDTLRPARHLLASFAAHDDINPIAVWVDTGGRLARLDVSYAARPEKRVRIDVTLSLALEPLQSAPDLADVLTPPPAEQVVEVGSMEELRSALDQWAQLEPGAGAAPAAGGPA